MARQRALHEETVREQILRRHEQELHDNVVHRPVDLDQLERHMRRQAQYAGSTQGMTADPRLIPWHMTNVRNLSDWQSEQIQHATIRRLQDEATRARISREGF